MLVLVRNHIRLLCIKLSWKNKAELKEIAEMMASLYKRLPLIAANKIFEKIGCNTALKVYTM